MLKREHKVSNISSEAIFAIPAMKPSRVIFASIFCLFLMITDIRYESGTYIRSFSNDILKPISFLTRFLKFSKKVTPAKVELIFLDHDDLIGQNYSFH